MVKSDTGSDSGSASNDQCGEDQTSSSGEGSASDEDDAPRPTAGAFARVEVLWAVSIICSGVTPGLTVFTTLFAESGMFHDVCGSDPAPCKGQESEIAEVLGTMLIVAYLGALPGGVLLDAWGARYVCMLGAAMLAGGVAMLTMLLSAPMAWAPAVYTAVAIVDMASQIQSFGMYGFLFHLPGWQLFVISNSVGCSPAAAMLPFLIKGLMDWTGASLQLAMLAWVAAIGASVLVIAKVVPTQAEYLEQAQRVLRMPLPRSRATLARFKETVSGAWRIVRSEPWTVFVLAISVLAGVAGAPWSPYAVNWGDAVFHSTRGGDRLGELVAEMTVLQGLVVVPLTSVIINGVGYAWLAALIAAVTVVLMWAVWQMDWPAQVAAAFASTMFLPIVTLFLFQWSVFISPPQRLGAVSGVMSALVSAFLVPIIVILQPTADREATWNMFTLWTSVTGAISAAGFALVFCRVANGRDLEVVLVEEDEVDLLMTFSVCRFEDAEAVLDMPRRAILEGLASQNMLRRRAVLDAFLSDAGRERYAALARRRAQALPPREARPGEPAALGGGSVIRDAAEEEIEALAMVASHKDGGDSDGGGGSMMEWLTAGWPAEERRQFTGLLFGIAARAAHRWGRALLLEPGGGAGAGAGPGALLFCCPPGELERSQAVPVGGDRWFHGVHANGGRDPFAEVLRADPGLSARLVTYGALQGELTRRQRHLGPHWYVELLAAPGGGGDDSAPHLELLLRHLARLASLDRAPCYAVCGKDDAHVYKRCGYRVLWSDCVDCDGSELIVQGMFLPAKSSS